VKQNRKKGCCEELVKTHGGDYAQKHCKRISTYCVICPKQAFPVHCILIRGKNLQKFDPATRMRIFSSTL
jgi:hypothetical protein